MNHTFTLIGTRGSPGIRQFQNALRIFGQPEAQLISYDDIIDNGIDRYDLTGRTVRIDSPGRNGRVYAKILALGAAAIEQSGATPCKNASGYDKGEIIHPRQWYLGFCRILSMIRDHAARRQTSLLSAPDEIATMFCKTSTRALLHRNGIPVPDTLGSPSNYTQLRERMQQRGRSRVFIKLNHGSAASGMMALAVSRQRMQAYSTVESAYVRGRTRLFNTRKIRCYRSETEIAAVIDRLCDFGVHAEDWIPKIGIQGRTCDLRVLVINRRPAHSVLRMARSPFTNLHLRNRRAGAELLVDHAGQAVWQEILHTCTSCAGLFPNTLHAGLDIAVSTGKKKHFVLEVNAFGDQLNGILHNNRTPHEAQVAALLAKPEMMSC